MDNLGAVPAMGGLVPSDPDRIYGGSNTPRIQELVISIDDCCIEANVDRRTFWVPLTLNVIGDYMSKLGTADVFSFTVQPWVREMLDSSFGTHTIAVTVLHHITQSRFLPPGTIPSSSNNMQNGLMLFLATGPGDPLNNVKTTGYMLHTNLLGKLFIISKSARPKEQ